MIRVPPSEAIAQIVFAMSYAGGELPIFLDQSAAPSMRLRRPNIAERLYERAQRLDLQDSAEVAIGLPATATISILWASLETADSVKRASRFKPLPSIALRFGKGCRRLCIWTLETPMGHASIVAANKRLAYRFSSPQKWANPDALRVPCPGTFLRVGRLRPVPVLVTRLEMESWTLERITGRLRDPPRPYMERLRNGEVHR